LNPKSMIRLGVRLPFLMLLVTACSGPDYAVAPVPFKPPVPRDPPVPPNPAIPRITSVHVTAGLYMVTVGSTTELKVAVLADPGVEYTVGWSLPAGTTTATIDASTGALTAVAPGSASAKACATARLSNGETQTACGEAGVRVVTVLTDVGGRGLAFVRDATLFHVGWVGTHPCGDRRGSTGLVARWDPNRVHASDGQPAGQVAIVYRQGGWIRRPLRNGGGGWRSEWWTLVVA